MASMPDAPLVLATADEIRAIFRRARAAVVQIMTRDDDDDFDADEYRRESERLRAAVEALRFCCIAAGQLGDASLVPLVIDAIAAREDLDAHADDDVSAMSGALTWLLRAGAPVGPEVQALAAHHDPHLRAAVAAGLPARGEREIALLDALATDPIPDVRNAAKKALAPIREVAWWKGKFTSDPVARLLPDEALALKPTLERLSALLDEPRYRLEDRKGELEELVSALPDALLVDLVETIHSSSDAFGGRFPALLTALLARPGGLDAFKRLCAIWSEERMTYLKGDDLAACVAALPRAARAAVCGDLAAHAASFPPSVRTSLRGGPARLAAELAGVAWPPGEDLSPLLDTMLSISQELGDSPEMDWVLTGLRKALESDEADPTTILDRVLDARLAGHPGPWKRLGRSLDDLLERAPASALRPAAERAILTEDRASVAWGIAQLLGRARDGERDPPAPELLARFLAEPRYRAVVVGSTSLRKRAVAPLRAELREGKLSHREACEAISAVGELYGGVATSMLGGVSLAQSEASAEASRQEERQAIEAFLGPEALRGPPTAEEWAVLRAARGPLVRAGEPAGELKHALQALPPGPWSAEDRPVLEEAARRFLAEGEVGLVLPLAMALSSKPSEGELPLIDELIARAEPRSRPLLKMVRGTVRELLGLPKKPAVAPAGPPFAEAKAAEVEWMDMDEEEDD
jgi:hypothetical protein